MKNSSEMRKRSFRIELTYRGDGFSGWQIQRDKRTVQGVLMEKLLKLFENKPSVLAAGRTDAGVHALHQVIRVRGQTSLEPLSIKKALNGMLPPEIRVINVEEVDEGFHPLKVKGKIYGYFIYTGELLPPFLIPYFYHLRKKPDFHLLSLCAEAVKGRRDFSAFMNMGSSVRNTVREVFLSEWLKEGNFFIYIIGADGFLKQMVRILTGTMIDVASGRMRYEEFKELLEGGERKRAGRTAPPHALFLLRVFYEDSPLEWWEKKREEFLNLLKFLELLYL